MTAPRVVTNVALALVLLAALVKHASADPCSAAVQLDGAAELRDAVRVALGERGIATAGPESCRSVIVHVEPAESGMRLVLGTESSDTVTERVVSDAKTAAAVIESWARPELYAMLLPEPAAPPPVAADEVEILPMAPAPLALPSSATLPPFVLSAGLASALGGDGSLWMGAAARGCVRFGSTCIGALIRASEDTGTSGASYMHQTSRTAMELMLAIEVSRRRGALVLTSGALAGIGFDRRRREDAVAGNVEADGGGLRAGVHLGLARNISTHWAIGADASVDAAIFAASASADPDAMNLARQPRGFLRMELQLRYEVR